MAFEKITSEDTTGRGVTGLPAVPGLSVEEMQKKFDELSLDVIIPKFNALVEALLFLTGIESVSNEVHDSDKELITGKALVNYALAIGAGDMLKSVYDTNNNGAVDNADNAANAKDAEKLGGKSPEHYASADELAETNASLADCINSVSDVLHIVSFDPETGTLITKSADYTGE